MTSNIGRASERRAQRRHKRGTIWWEMVWPGLIITCIGLAGLLFLTSCARVAVWEVEVRKLRRQIDSQRGTQRQLWQRAAELRDRTRLRQFVAARPNMVLKPAATDAVRLPALPQQQCSISPLTPQPDTLVSRPEPTESPRASADRTVVAEAF